MTITGRVPKIAFYQATGREPQQDDMERSNCDRPGFPGHAFCGWCQEHNKPRFECGCALVLTHGI